MAITIVVRSGSAESRGHAGEEDSRLSFDAPRVVIGPRAVIGGSMVFQREVELHVSESAKVGTIEGATPRMFAGDTP